MKIMIDDSTDSKDKAIRMINALYYNKNQSIPNENNNDEPATEPQKKYMDQLGIEYTNKVTKKEASKLIELHVNGGE